MTRLADHCPECGELAEPSIVMPLRSSMGVECIYTCGCNPGMWVASIA